jgi:hypothetical protein
MCSPSHNLCPFPVSRFSLNIFFQKIDVTRMTQLLQSVENGYTEYSVIFLSKQKTFFVSVADMSLNGWWASHGNQWTQFHFDEIF